MEQYPHSTDPSISHLGNSDEDFGLLLPEEAENQGETNQSSYSA